MLITSDCLLTLLGSSSFVETEMRRELPKYTLPKSVRNNGERKPFEIQAKTVYKDDASRDLRDVSCHSIKVIQLGNQFSLVKLKTSRQTTASLEEECYLHYWTS